MKHLFNRWRRYLLVAALIVGVVVALPAAHAASLQAPHANNGVGIIDRHCSPATCDAFTPSLVMSLMALVCIAAVLVDPRSGNVLYLPPALDPPPRLIR